VVYRYCVSVKRRALDRLVAWKNDGARKPLVVRGARQVGKTWLLQEFASTYYEQVAYINCQRDQSSTGIFAGDLDPNRILNGIEIASRTTIDPPTTLVIIDEIQEAPRALTSLCRATPRHSIGGRRVVAGRGSSK